MADRMNKFFHIPFFLGSIGRLSITLRRFSHDFRNSRNGIGHIPTDNDKSNNRKDCRKNWKVNSRILPETTNVINDVRTIMNQTQSPNIYLPFNQRNRKKINISFIPLTVDINGHALFKGFHEFFLKNVTLTKFRGKSNSANIF